MSSISSVPQYAVVLVAAALVATAAFIIGLALHAPAAVDEVARTGGLRALGVAVPAAAVYLVPWAGAWLLGVAAAILVARARGVLTPAAIGIAIVFTAGFILGGTLQYRLEAYSMADVLRMTREDFVTPTIRMPLGWLVAALATIGWCRMTGLPWRDWGDAIAVQAALTGAVGRVGCLLSGCCMGVACTGNGAGLCLRYPHGTSVFLNQVATAGLNPTAAYSEPAHVLPAYFALGSLALLAVLFVLMRRGAPAGAMLATFGVLEPIQKMAFESLRAVPRRGPWMELIPLATMSLTVVGVVALRWQRRATMR
jgi:phosphatidylglycerol:prolipoprotein diacylglycerol transferase